MRRESAHTDIGPEVQAPLAPGIQKHEHLTVLVAMDLTDKANAALAPTSVLARAANARVLLLNVFLPSVHMGHVTAGTQEERIEYVRHERRQCLVEKARALEGVDVATRVEVQSHGEELDECIARVATEVHADVLVVVSKRVSGGVRAVLGSFAQGILRLSPVRCLSCAQTPNLDARRTAPRRRAGIHSRIVFYTAVTDDR